jgi:hypothetical protein
MPFGSSWSAILPVSNAPDPACGRSFVFHGPSQSLYAAYGQLPDESYSSRFFRFSLSTLRWDSLVVPGASPRAACGSTLIGDRIWFFGGLAVPGPLQDLHYVDINTLELVHPTTTGESPPPGSNPLMVAWRDLIVIWANSPRPFIYILDTSNLAWTRVATEHVHRLGTTGTIVGNTLYMFGASIEMTMLTLDLETFAVAVVRTSGIEPDETQSLATVPVGAVVFAFETIGSAAANRLFVLDAARLMWHSFAVTPPVADALTAIAAFYIEETRRLIGVWSAGDRPPTVAELKLGGPLARINHNLDMITGLGELARPT